MKIWLRLAITILLSVIVAGAGLIYWATLEQRKIAAEQARDFADSVHQMTLAGLTGMMITGTIEHRAIFLEQIKAMSQIDALKVIRGPEVVNQYGKGFAGETIADPVELAVMDSRQASYAILTGGDGQERLKAVLPAIAQSNYLGKDCLSCHKVAEGTVLGVVSMEISLEKSAESTREFKRHAIFAAIALCIPLGILIWLSIVRLVSRPLSRMTRGLNRVADGEIDDADELPVGRLDEVGLASASFNRVMAKAKELIRQQRLSRLVFDNSLEGITVTDANARIQMVNKAFTDTTGYSADEAIGQTPALLRSGRQGPEFYQEFWNSLRGNGEWRGEIWNRRKNGSIYPEWLNISSVRNMRGEVEYYVAIFSDITERKEREDRVTHQAFHDALTGLPNRLLFQDRLNQALGQAKRNRTRTPAVMFLDLDRFKQINDTFGHDAGDMLLKEVANRLRRCVRAADTVARLAGDEFTVLLPEITGPDDAKAVADKILDAMQEPVVLGHDAKVISTSIGISLYPKDGRDPESLIKSADAAMYHVKGSGRAAYCFFTPDLLDKPTRRLETEERLQKALERKEFDLIYQPIFDLETGGLHGREALLRWRQADGSVLPASDFVGIAEALGLMGKIGEWVLERACLQARAWQDQAAPMIVAVNLSAAEFRRPDIVTVIRETLRSTGLSPHLLEIEIPEMLAMHDSEYTIDVLTGLADIGVVSVLDDFGTGYSNLNVLHRLPIKSVKIDRSLIHEETKRTSDHSVLGAIFSLAKALGLNTVAEGIETEAELAIVRDLACHRAQGRMLDL